jgi:hypothetical protein
MLMGPSSQAAETQGELRTTLLPNFPRASRTPLRDISPQPPTLHDDDVDMELRRKRPTSISLSEQNISTSRSIKRLLTRARKSGESDNQVDVKLEGSGSPLNRDTGVISIGDFDSPIRRESVPPEPERV